MNVPFYVVGTVSVVQVARATGEDRKVSHSFSRKVMAKNAEDAYWMVIASVKGKYCKATGIYDVKAFVVDSVDVFGKVLHKGG